MQFAPFRGLGGHEALVESLPPAHEAGPAVGDDGAEGADWCSAGMGNTHNP